MSLQAVISYYTSETAESKEDVGRFEDVTFVYSSLPNTTFQITINDGENRLDDPSIWMDFLQEEDYTATFGSVYGSHVDNGEIYIDRRGQVVEFLNDNAQGCKTTFTIPFEQCKTAFMYLRDQCLQPRN